MKFCSANERGADERLFGIARRIAAWGPESGSFAETCKVSVVR
jgi:hypothetical protein